MTPSEIGIVDCPVATAPEHSCSITDRPTSGLHVLFVDDDPFVIAAMRRMLRCLQDSCEFTFCQSADDALRTLEHQPCDLIISDLQMPGMDGAELLRRISVEHPSVVRFALSGQADPNRDTPVSAVAHRFLPKPCEPARLRTAIEQLAAARTPVLFAEDLDCCTSLPSLPMGRAAEDAIQQWCQHRPGTGNIQEVDHDLAASMMVLRLANFAAAEPVVALPSELITTFRGPTLHRLLEGDSAAWPTLCAEALQALRMDFSQSLGMPVNVDDWYRMAKAYLPQLLALSFGWPSDQGANPRWQTSADYLFVLWTGQNIHSY